MADERDKAGKAHGGGSVRSESSATKRRRIEILREQRELRGMLDDFGDETLLEELEESVFGSEDSERYLAADGVEMEAPQSDGDGDDDLELEDFGDED